MFRSEVLQFGEFVFWLEVVPFGVVPFGGASFCGALIPIGGTVKLADRAAARPSYTCTQAASSLTLPLDLFRPGIVGVPGFMVTTLPTAL